MSALSNSQKSKKLRPVRIILAVLVATLIILILTTFSPQKSQKPTADAAKVDTEKSELKTSFYDLTGFSDLIDDELASEGIPPEEFENLDGYLDKDEIFTLEVKATLAEKLDNNIIKAEDVAKLYQIFDIDETYFEEKLDFEPEEYLNLEDLLEEYYHSLNTVEDYDIIEA